jgi:hypothetical protein
VVQRSATILVIACDITTTCEYVATQASHSRRVIQQKVRVSKQKQRSSTLLSEGNEGRTVGTAIAAATTAPRTGRPV